MGLLWSTTCTDHFGLSKTIVRVGKPQKTALVPFLVIFCFLVCVFRMFLATAAQPGSKYGFGRRLIAACAAMPGERVRRYNAWNCAKLRLQHLDLNSAFSVDKLSTLEKFSFFSTLGLEGWDVTNIFVKNHKGVIRRL